MNDIIKGLRLLLGVPALSDFFIGFGLAIVVKGIELLIRYYTFWLHTGGVGSFKDYEERK